MENRIEEEKSKRQKTSELRYLLYQHNWIKNLERRDEISYSKCASNGAEVENALATFEKHRKIARSDQENPGRTCAQSEHKWRGDKTA